MRKLYIIILKVFLIIVFSSLKAISNEKIKIGLIVPLSGEYSYIGNSILKSTRMALNKINDEKIEIIFKKPSFFLVFKNLKVTFFSIFEINLI